MEEEARWDDSSAEASMTVSEPWRCPCGIPPESHHICSAGTCWWCLADRVKAQSDAEDNWQPERDRRVAEEYAERFPKAQSDAELERQIAAIEALAAERKESAAPYTAELHAALAQSDAEPVAWLLESDDPGLWDFTFSKHTAKKHAEKNKKVRPMFAAPPRSDASARLIEAERLTDTAARIINRLQHLIDLTAVQPKRVWRDIIVSEIETMLRARAADRSGK